MSAQNIIIIAKNTVLELNPTLSDVFSSRFSHSFRGTSYIGVLSCYDIFFKFAAPLDGFSESVIYSKWTQMDKAPFKIKF